MPTEASGSGLIKSILTGPDRDQGYDLARGLAVVLMLFINFTAVFYHPGQGAGSFFGIIDLLDRRAAVILVMISGAGLSMMAGRRTAGGDPGYSWFLKKQILYRAMFLLIFGCLLSLVWSGDILHFYGVFICIGLVFLYKSGRVIVSVMGLCWLLNLIPQMDAGMIFLEEYDHFLVNPIKDILFTGYFPVFPWMIFFFTGMLMGRKPLQGSSSVLALLVFAILMTVSDAVFTIWAESNRMPVFLDAWWLAVLTGVSDSLPFSVLSGIGTGLLGILSGTLFSQVGTGRVNRLVIVLGRTSLSIYVLHILFILAVSELMNLPHGSFSPAPAVAFFLGGYLLFICFWLKTHLRGPLETLMRRFDPGITNTGSKNVRVYAQDEQTWQ